MSHRNLILIGLPASGKTTVGRLTAERLGWSFIDTDHVMEQRENVAIQALMDERGMEGYRKAEESAVLSLNGAHSVIATGGSVVYSAASMEHLIALGSVIYLELSREQWAERLAASPSRPIVVPEGMTWNEMVAERMTLYRRYAQHTLPAQGTAEDVMERVIRVLNNG
jgi:shikimate kinase